MIYFASDLSKEKLFVPWIFITNLECCSFHVQGENLPMRKFGFVHETSESLLPRPNYVNTVNVFFLVACKCIPRTL
jgi:hypothetical protein